MTQAAAFTLRLFRRSDPFQPIECRELQSGELAIGRDPGVGWPLEDPDRALSRQHCTLALDGGRLMLRDTSTNGVYIGPERRRAPSRSSVEIAPGEAFRFGPYLVAVEQTQFAVEEPRLGAAGGRREGTFSDSENPTKPRAPRATSQVLGEMETAALSDWSAPTHGGASMLDPFCAGAGLDPSSFLDEDPALVMRRAGSVYRQMVIGLTELMNERTVLKTDYELDRTTVHASGNNPFRWASAERVGLDLLRPRTDGFLSGAAAVDSAFTDLKNHLSCTLAGIKGALNAALDALSPAVVEASLQKRSFFPLARRAAAWGAYKGAHGELRTEAHGDAEGDANGVINRGFRSAYQRQMQALDSLRVRP